MSSDYALELLESLSDAFYGLDLDWRFVYLNRKAEQLLDRKREELIGKVIWEEFPYAIKTQTYVEMHTALEKQQIIRFETFSLYLQIWVEVEVSPTPTGLSVYFHDITQRKQSADALTRLAAIVTFSTDAIISKTLQGIITSWNEGAEKIFGYSEKEMLQKPITILIPPEKMDEEAMFLQKIAADEVIRNYDTFRLKKDGSLVYISVSLSPLKDQYGTIVGISKIARDITSRKRAESALNQYVQRLEILHEIDNGLIRGDSISKIIEMTLKRLQQIIPCQRIDVSLVDEATNEAIIFAIACDNDTVLGEGVRIPLTQDIFEGYDAKHTRLFDDIRLFQETRPRAKQLLQEGLLSALSVLLIDGEHPIGAIMLFADSTSFFTSEHQSIVSEIANQITIAIRQLQLNTKLANYTGELEQNVVERTAQLVAANQELDAFAYIVSHDLKAPIRGISQLAGWLTSDYVDRLDDDGRNLLRLMIGRTKRMHEMIEGILQYSRVGRVKENPTKIDLNVLVHQVVDLLSPPDGVTINIAPDLPILYGYEIRIRQVFQNLISNAIKYMGKPTGLVTLTWQDDETHWQFAITDTGQGIASQYHEKVFQLFQTLTPRDEVESTGIGLSLVRKIVELHNGRVWLESEVGKGSAFYFTLAKRMKEK